MSESWELYNILYGKTSLPKMSPIPDINQFKDKDEMERNPLCTFQLQKVRKREFYNMVEEAASKAKIAEFRIGVKGDIRKCHLEMPQAFYYSKIKEFAEMLPTVGLLPDWERNIRNLVPKSLRIKYNEFFENQLNETKTRYYQEMHDMAVRRIIASEDGNKWPEYVEPAHKCKGRTKFRPKFLKHRCIITKKYYFPHKLIKNIISRAYFVLPELIIDFRRYHSSGFQDLNRLLDLIEGDMKKGSLIITNTYYTDIVRLISQPRYIHDVPPEIVPSFLRCASKILELQIVNRMMNTIEHLLKVLSDWSTTPLLRVI
ncbi:uncharacterized protein LOC112493850 [Cephus cinctus]|uniref:Uncharacterized protein LOC112493850 n=1 Tax=Cephus cinctus TaxID=211228 RepID=A0AAJ7RAN6_CEPCN|nr:uncharacterized protein LOC112493850 [Cephus cinctus]